MNEHFKVRIFQPVVPEYRVALFDGVGERYGERVEILAGQSIGADVSYPLAKMLYDYDHPLWRFGPFFWQRGLSLHGLKKGDVIVVCGDVHQLSSLWIALKARICGIGVVWWGHHLTATSKKWGVKIRLAVARLLNDVFLCYTSTGVAYLVANGFRKGRVFATGNTIDQEPIKTAIAHVSSSAFRERHSAAPYFLCCGVLREKIRLELALWALADDRLRSVNLVVIGDGPMKEKWQKLATELGLASRVQWISGTRDQSALAPWFLGAKAFVYPGAIGLSILHSFSYALPVITHGNAEHQMPEFEVMEDGKTGYCFREGDVEDLIACCQVLLSDEKARAEMARHCQKLAFTRYSMEQMVNNFCVAVEEARRLSGD